MADPNLNIPYPEFTVPHIDYTQLDLTWAGGATPRAEINPQDFRVSEDMVVERYIISADDYAVAAAPQVPFTTFLPRVDMIWWKYGVKKPAGPFRPIPCFDTAVYERTSYLGSAAGQLSFRLGWQFTHPQEMKDTAAIFGYWANPAPVVAPGMPAGTFYVTMHGKGQDSGEHLTVHAPVTTLVGGAGSAGYFGPGALGQGRNLYGETILIDQLLVHMDTTAYPLRDTRLLNNLRLAIWFDAGKQIRIGSQDFAYPLFCYGSHRSLDGLVTIFEPEGGPVLYPMNEGTGFEFNNLNATALRLQVARVGRLRPLK